MMPADPISSIRAVLTIVVGAIAAAVIVAMGFALQYQGKKISDLNADLYRVKASHSDQLAASNARITEDLTRVIKTQKEALNESETKLGALRSAAAVADRRVAGLLQSVADARAAAQTRERECTAAPESSPAVDIYELFGSCVVEYRSLAEAAEQSRIAGQLCEASYDALTPLDKSDQSSK